MIELPTLIVDELTAELDASNIECGMKDHGQGAPEDAQSPSIAKISTDPEEAVASGVKNENSQKGNHSANHMLTKKIGD